MPRMTEVYASLLFIEVCISLCNWRRVTCRWRAWSGRLPDAPLGLACAQVTSLSRRAFLGLCWIAVVQVRSSKGEQNLGEASSGRPRGVGRGHAVPSCLQEVIAGTRDQARDAELALQAVVSETTTHPWGLNVKGGGIWGALGLLPAWSPWAKVPESHWTCLRATPSRLLLGVSSGRWARRAVSEVGGAQPSPPGHTGLSQDRRAVSRLCTARLAKAGHPVPQTLFLWVTSG